MPPAGEFDAVIVGARCAGGTLALALAERGSDVLVVDRDRFPSDTVSTHFAFPSTLARFERLGVPDRLRAGTTCRWSAIGSSASGTRRPGVSHRTTASTARPAPAGSRSTAILETALAGGARARLGERVVDLIGAGTQDDPGGRCRRRGRRADPRPLVFGPTAGRRRSPARRSPAAARASTATSAGATSARPSTTTGRSPGRFPRPEGEPQFKAWAGDAAAGQALRDSFSRRVAPSHVLALTLG